MMELKTNLIHRNYQKCDARTQLTIGDDYSLPEGKPDLASILQKKAEICVEEVHTEKGKIKLRGMLKIDVFYLTERSQKAADHLNMEFPFDEVLYMEGAANGDNLKIDWKLEELRVTIIHPGKLSVRALVGIYGSIQSSEGHAVTEHVEECENTHVKTGSFVMAEPTLEKRDSYRIRDEISLPVNKPNVQSILWENMQLRGLELRMQEGRLAVKGEVLVLVIYQAEEELSDIQWLEQTVPFQGTMDVTGLTPEMFGMIETEVSHQKLELKPDYDGELRMFQLEMLLDISMHLYEERTLPVLQDVYSTREKLEPEFEEISYEKLRMCSQTKCRLSGQERIEEEPRLLQILGHHAQLQNQRSRMSEEGILCEGNLEVQVLYLTASDHQPFGTAAISVPYSQLIEVPDIRKEDQWRVCESVEQLSVNMAQSSLIEVRAVVLFHACVMEQCRLKNISGIGTQPYDLEAYKKAPGMRIHFVQPKETLWKIAKENRTTVEDLKRLNDLNVDEVTSGQKLILLKMPAEPAAV